MLQIDLSALNRSELRLLLDAARARGQVALIADLQAELAVRASGERRAQPLSPHSAPSAFSDDDETLPMIVPADLPELSLAPDLGRRRAERRPMLAPVAFALLVAGGAGAWGLNGAPGLNGGGEGAEAASSPAAAAPLEPPPRAMVARVEPAPTAPNIPEPVEAPPTSPPKPVAVPARQVASAPSEPDRPRRLDPCARPPTAADRALCNDLGLNLLDHELREAYGQAMMAGADPAALRDSQAAWRRTRDPVADPRVLAQLYDRRIRDLKAMAAPGASQP